MKKMFNKLIEGLDEVKSIIQDKTESARISRKKLRIPAPPVFSADEIRSIRTKDGCSQESFAQILGISVETVRKWEQGKNEPTTSNLRLLQIIRNHPEVIDELLKAN